MTPYYSRDGEPSFVLDGRFWAKVRIAAGCWEWTGATDSHGYGRFHLGRRNHPAHRLAWEAQNGSIASGLQVCHTCDNPSCVRLDHLFLGTPSENALDAVRKGRSAGGYKPRVTAERRHQAVVRAQAAYQLQQAGLSTQEIAQRMAVDSWSVLRWFHKYAEWLV